MEHGKIRLINSGTDGGADGYTQTIAYAFNNRLYRITNDGPGNGNPGNMRIWVTRKSLFRSYTTLLELQSGRSVDVFGSQIKVEALETLQLFGSFDTI